MPNCQNDCLFTIEMVENDVGSVAEFDEPLTELRRHFIKGTSNCRMFSQSLHALADCRYGSLRCFTALGSEKIV